MNLFLLDGAPQLFFYVLDFNMFDGPYMHVCPTAETFIHDQYKQINSNDYLVYAAGTTIRPHSLCCHREVEMTTSLGTTHLIQRGYMREFLKKKLLLKSLEKKCLFMEWVEKNSLIEIS